MNLDLKCDGFENYLVEKFYRIGGVQYLFRFENGFGASVIKGSYSIGASQDLWELAILRYFDSGAWDYDLYYGTEITDGIVGYQSDSDICGLLERIKAL